MTIIADINKTNIILNGVPASAGVAIGKVFILEDDDFVLIEKEISLIEFFSSLYVKYNKEIKIEMKDNSIINEIIEYLNINIKEDISLNDLSKKFNLSTFYITKLFKKELNIPAHSYFINLKIEFAKDLLKNGLNISQTALECGFCDQSHFHRNFKKIVAITPKQYQDNFVQ